MAAEKTGKIGVRGNIPQSRHRGHGEGESTVGSRYETHAGIRSGVKLSAAETQRDRRREVGRRRREEWEEEGGGFGILEAR
jgi:hypothetical protein